MSAEQDTETDDEDSEPCCAADGVEPWDAEAAYDEHISPLMTQIIVLCKEHQIPLVAVFQYANDEDDGPAFCTTTIPADRECERMREINRFVKPKREGFALAETIVTNPDGSKHITIRRVS